MYFLIKSPTGFTYFPLPWYFSLESTSASLVTLEPQMTCKTRGAHNDKDKDQDNDKDKDKDKDNDKDKYI